MDLGVLERTTTILLCGYRRSRVKARFPESKLVSVFLGVGGDASRTESMLFMVCVSQGVARYGLEETDVSEFCENKIAAWAKKGQKIGYVHKIGVDAVSFHENV